MKLSSLQLLLILWCSTLSNGFTQRTRCLNPISQRRTAKSYNEIASSNLNSRAICMTLSGDIPLQKRKVIPRVLDRAIVPIAAHFTICYFALREIREVGKANIGHAHGLASLALLKLLCLFATIQTQVYGINKDIEEFGDIEWRPLTVLRRMLLSPLLSMIVSVFAVVAAVMEIFQDLMPGGHHGMALLAMSSFQSQFRRFRKIRNKNKSFQKTPDRAFVSALKNAIPISAALFACYELYEDLTPGAHHGVPLMALSEIVENIYRARKI